MKNFFLFLLIMLAVEGYSQKPYTFYKTLHGEYEIKVSSTKNAWALWIDMLSMDTYKDKVGIKIEPKQAEVLVEAFNVCIEKYSEWKNVAIANNVTKLQKKIKVRSTRVLGFFYSIDEWNFCYNMTPTFEFSVVKDAKEEVNYYIIMRTGEMSASDNEYLKCDGGVFAFASVQEIESFIALLDNDKIVKSINAQTDQNDLFKD